MTKISVLSRLNFSKSCKILLCKRILHKQEIGSLKLQTRFTKYIKMRLLFLVGVGFLAVSSFAQNQTCPEGQVLCEGTEDECIPEEYICDGTFIDCSNDADEPDDCPCPDGYFRCDDILSCYPDTWICDGIPICNGGEDEPAVCPSCNEGGFHCDDGSCIALWKECDGFADCAGGEDETRGLTCVDGTCIPAYSKCDGYPHCVDGSDEANCTTSADPQPFPSKGFQRWIIKRSMS